MNLNYQKTQLLFYDINLGYPTTGLPFYANMLPDQRVLHVKDNLLNINSPLDVFFEVLNRKILAWEQKYKNAISYAVFLIEKNVNKKLFWEFILKNASENYSRWNFILTSSDLEFGLPHTNSEFIFIPEKYIQECIDENNYEKLAKTCFHEKIHVLQRYAKTNLFELLSEKLGYIYYTNVYPLFIQKIKNLVHIDNPDTFGKGYYIFKNKKTDDIYFFVLFYNKKKNTMQRKSFIYIKKKVIWQFSDFIPFHGKISQYEHPYEVIATLWSNLLFK